MFCDNILLENYMISIKNLYLSFTKEFDALHNINLEILDEEKVALVGQADSGKTMLLRVIANLEKIKSGEVYIKNINLKKINFKQDVQVAFVPKSFVFFNKKTVKENLEYILKVRNFDQATINAKIVTALKTFDIDGIQNMKIKNLSPYQKTLVELARASMRKVELFLIDDICSELDRNETENVLTKLNELIIDNPGSTFIFAFSDENLANRLGLKIIHLKDGMIVDVNDENNDL